MRYCTQTKLSHRLKPARCSLPHVRRARYRVDKLPRLHAELKQFTEFASEVAKAGSLDADKDALLADRDHVLDTLRRHVEHCRALEALLSEWGA